MRGRRHMVSRGRRSRSGSRDWVFLSYRTRSKQRSDLLAPLRKVVRHKVSCLKMRQLQRAPQQLRAPGLEHLHSAHQQRLRLVGQSNRCARAVRLQCVHACESRQLGAQARQLFAYVSCADVLLTLRSYN